MRSRGTRFFRLAATALAALLAAVALCAEAGPTGATTDNAYTRLSGHVLPALSQAIRQSQISRKRLTGSDATDAEPLTLTVVLRRDDEAGFQRYLRDVYDSASPLFHKFLSPLQIAKRFGPSQQVYDDTLAWLRGQGLELVEGSTDRMTLTLRGTRDVAAKAFDVVIDDYTLGSRSFYANDAGPALPAALAAHVQYIGGLSNLARPVRPQPQRMVRLVFGIGVCDLWSLAAGAAFKAGAGPNASFNYYPQFISCFKNLMGKSPYDMLAGSDPPPPAWQDADGSGQTVGLVEFDSYTTGDVADYIDLIGLPAGKLADVSQVHVNGGAGAPGAGQDEVLLDIDTVLTLAPGAKIAVYDGPFTGRNTSFQSMFNAMIAGGVDIISNSWAYCEDQTTLADVQSIDSILQTAAASGISVFNGSGDTGSACLDGAANTIGVPADSPNATAVGGSSLTQGPGHTYGSETWWNGSTDTPPSGSGGYGVSRYFARPSYQDGFDANSARSIPDVVSNADPAHGAVICNASEGGCPTNALNGGTSFAAPTWAAFTALLNQTQGGNLGLLNAQLYALAPSGVFHDAASMGSDFAHVGLGSPRLAALHEELTAQTTGSVDASVSRVWVYGDDNLTAYPETANGLVRYDDGSTKGYVVVKLADAMGNLVAGKTVTLAANSGAHAVVAPASAVTDASGNAIFTVTDLTAESLVLTAQDETDGVTLQQTGNFDFIVAPAASAGITAFPTTVNADGSSTTTITVTLKDALDRPTPGKLINLSQGTARSVVTGPNPAVTDASGQIVFTATDVNSETVTYAAVDVSDGDLPVPGSPAVTFQNGVGSCITVTPIASAGYMLTPYVTGQYTQNFFYGNVNWGCAGNSGLAFDASGSVYVTDSPQGQLFRLPGSGGAAASPLSTPGPTIGQLVFGPDGSLYASHGATTGNFTTGDIVQLDPATGATIRVIASNLTCPGGLAVDPLSGDLFFDDGCTGAGSDNPSLFRVENPSGDTPTVVTYATLPASPNGQLSFAPDGTLYVVVGYYNQPQAPVYAVSGTDKPQPPTITQIPDLTSTYWVRVGRVDPDGSARSLLVQGGAANATLEDVDITTAPYTVTPLADGVGTGPIGPDGCMYVSNQDTVYRLASTSGSCAFATTNPSPSLTLSPSVVSPNPSQGGTQSFTATFRNLVVPAGTPVLFQVGGVNAQTRLVRTSAGGTATFDESGVHAGSDTVVATATVGGTTLTSNTTQLTWNSGPHTTFLSLDPSPLGATAGQTITVAASLTDVSVSPSAALSGQTVTFTLGSATCSATTGASGIAGCALAVGGAGASVLSANFSGTANLLPSSDDSNFYALAAAALATTTTTLVATPDPVASGQSLTLTATVSSAATASGTVVFTDNGNPVGSVVLGPTGQATFGTSSLTVGTHSLVANYGGDASDASSSSLPVIVTVVSAATTVVAVPTLTRWALLGLIAGVAVVAAMIRRRRLSSGRWPGGAST